MSHPPKVFMMDLWATVPYYTAYLSKALLHEGLDLTVGSISYYLDPDCFRSRGIPLTPGVLDIVGKLSLPKLPRRLLKLGEATLNLLALCVRFMLSRPDVIHVQYLPMLRWPLPLDWWFVSLCQSGGSKVVLTVHDLMPHDTADRHKSDFQALYRDVDAIICHSDHIAKRLQAEFNVSLSKIDVIAHGPFFYDLPAPASTAILQSFSLEGAKPLFLWQGIIFPYKGIDLLLDAWQAVEHELPEACLLIAGTGSPELLDQIRRQVNELHLQNVHLHMRFITTEELVTLYRAADVVVYPYRAITTSGALATGLALGKTIVASNLPVFRELLTHQETALLVDPQNKQEFASALIRLGTDSALRHQFASRIRDMQFGDQTWYSIAKRTIATYAEVLSGDTRPFSARHTDCPPTH